MEISEPVVNEKSSFNFFTSIWIVPFIALIIGGWLVYEHFSKLGPEIKIYFKNSSGLVAGQSVVKYRDVSVGKVTKIEIDNKNEGVIVYARLNKDVEPFLNETTKFWIVKPEVDYSGVRGLDTLLSGSYIAMTAKKGKKFKNVFKGLDKKFIDIGDDTYYALEVNFQTNVVEGTPIYFKGIKVGVVTDMSLDTESKNIMLLIRVYKDYNILINESTKFWVQSLVDLKLTDNRVEFNMAPLPTLILSGISFETSFDKKYDNGLSKIFKLYKGISEAKSIRIGLSKPQPKEFVLKFKGDVSSLEIGTPIKYKGFQVGEIKKLTIAYSKIDKNFEAKALGVIDLANFSTSKEEGLQNFKELMKDGLVAKLEKSNPILNLSNIVLTEDNSSNVNCSNLIIDKEYNLPIFPTKGLDKTDLIGTINSIAKKLKDLDLDKTVANVNTILEKTQKPIDNLNKILINANKTIDSINKIVSKKDFRDIGKNLNKSIKEFEKALKDTQKLLNGYNSNSLFGDKLDATLKELHNTTEQTNRLLHKLNRKPNSLIFGD